MHDFTLTAIVSAFAELPQVEAILLGGSLAGPDTTAIQDSHSDYDIYIYVSEAVPTASRRQIAEQFADRMEIDNQFWEPGDEWLLRDTGIGVDIMYRWWDWITGELERVVERNQASVGYTTCFWYNILYSHILYDPNGTAAALQQRCRVPYSDRLVDNIIRKNHPILRDNISSYRAQISKALGRDDVVSLNHRAAEFLASYFDIVFAALRTLHPGEKKLLAILAGMDTPPAMDSDGRRRLASAAGTRNTASRSDTSSTSDTPAIIANIDTLMDRLDTWLDTKGLLQ